MNDDPRNGETQYRLRELEQKMRDLQDKGSPATRILQVQVDALKERISNIERELSWARRSVILVTATGVVALFVWLIQGGGAPT